MNLSKHWTAAICITLAMWVVFAGWQYREFVHERAAVRDTLLAQVDSLSHSLFAGIRSHRRMGRFFAEQIQDVIAQLVEGPNVLAAQVEDAQYQILASAGVVSKMLPERELEIWQPEGLQTSGMLEVTLDSAGPGRRGPSWLREAGILDSEVREREFVVTLLIDRQPTDLLIQRAARLRLTVSLAGIAAIGGLALAWQGRSRAWRARAQADLLRAESDRLQELGQAAAGLAHETRNPLGVIRGNLQALLNQRQASEQTDDPLRVLIEECDRVTARINQFLAFARPKEAEPRQVDLTALTKELEALLEPDLESGRLRLSLRCEIPQCALQADPDLLRQILFNLLQNAIAFAPPDTEVTLEASSQTNGKLAIAVCDRGPGIDESDRKMLFSPYYTTRSDGAGLGLAIVRRLVRLHGWHIVYESREGGGACFRIEGIDGQGGATHPDRR